MEKLVYYNFLVHVHLIQPVPNVFNVVCRIGIAVIRIRMCTVVLVLRRIVMVAAPQVDLASLVVADLATIGKRAAVAQHEVLLRTDETRLREEAQLWQLLQAASP